MFFPFKIFDVDKVERGRGLVLPFVFVFCVFIRLKIVLVEIKLTNETFLRLFPLFV